MSYDDIKINIYNMLSDNRSELIIEHFFNERNKIEKKYGENSIELKKYLNNFTGFQHKPTIKQLRKEKLNKLCL